MRYFFFIFLWMLLVQLPVFGQAAGNNRPPAKTNETSYGDITPDRVKQFCDMLRKSLEDDLKDYPKVSYAKYSAYRRTLADWINYSFLELDSDIDISWFKKLHVYLKFCYNTKKEYDLSPFKAEAEQKVINKKRFEAGFANFKKFMEVKPPKPPPQRLEVLKRQKQEYLRARKVEERKKNSGGKTRKLFDDEG